MANTIVLSGYIIELSSIDADWLYSVTLGDIGRVKIHSIELIPAASGDHCVIKEGGETGVVIYDKECIDISANFNLIEYYGQGEFKPFLDVSDGSYNAAAKVKIILGK